MQTPTPTAINADLLQALVSLGPLIERMSSIDSGTDRWEQTKQITDQARAAVTAALRQEVLDELIYAEKLIAKHFLGSGARVYERRAAIARAGGSL